jgi:hypothetical protein
MLKAVKLIRPKKSEIVECRSDVEATLTELEISRTQHRWTNLDVAKKGKVASTKLAAAIRRFATALKSADLPYHLAIGMPVQPKGGLYRLRTPSSSFKTSSQVCDYVPVLITSLDWSAFAAECDQVEIGPATQIEAAAKHQAAKEALELLRKYRPNADDFSVAPRSVFCSLARVLYGNENANLHFHCKFALRKIRSTK